MQLNTMLAFFLPFLLMIGNTSGRIHKLDIRKDTRQYISLSIFGFYKGGSLTVNLTNFKLETPNDNNAVFGFSLERTLNDVMNPSVEYQDRCLLHDLWNVRSDVEQKDGSSFMYFTMDLKDLMLRVNCSRNVRKVHIYKDPSMILVFRTKRGSLPARFSDTALFPRRKRNISHEIEKSEIDDSSFGTESNVCSRLKLPITMETVKGEKLYNTSFVLYVANEDEEGLYNLHFHNCPKYETPVPVDFTIQIAEVNNDNFLSAGDMPLPALYFMMSLLFFLSGCFWIFILNKSKNPVFKIHYFMAALVYLKSLSLLFHGINYHFIQTTGEHVAAWAILYYITHVMKGALLFITIVLVGTGWTFIKHILADKEKKVFMLVIPLQVLANAVEIIIEESEEGDIEHQTWRDIFILVDLLCCGAILFPVVWSIRHLEDAAHTSDKAAINLRKLKLFRHFYIMIVGYIYFTRIIVYLLKITVRFEYEWLDEMFREMATYVFFVLTGYKFRPASANPYFTVPNDEVEDEGDKITDVVYVLLRPDRVSESRFCVSGGSGITEGLSKVSKVPKAARPLTSDIPSTQEERDSLFHKTEACHEYD